MRILPITDSAVAEALRILRNGGVVAHATETCYGLACDLTNAEAVAKLFQIKHRTESQPVSALFPSVEEAKKYVQWNTRAEELAEEHLPGPLTLILPLRTDAPMTLFPIPRSPKSEARSPSIGIRISSHPLAMRLVTTFGNPLSTTSANLHGKPNPYSAQDILAQFGDQLIQPDLIIDSGVLSPTPPSTVIDMTEATGILRKGSLKIE